MTLSVRHRFAGTVTARGVVSRTERTPPPARCAVMRIPASLAVVLPAAALLAGCGPSSTPAPAPSASATPVAGDYVARVKALPSGQRVGVLFRAIRDAGQSCQKVIDEQALPSAKGGAWLATCDDQSHWVVSIANDGTAIVVNARDLQQPRR